MISVQGSWSERGLVSYTEELQKFPRTDGYLILGTFAAISGTQQDVKFDILDKQGELVLRAEEQAKVSEMRIKTPNRGFTIHVKDLTGDDIIAMKREYRCRGSCSPCRCLQEMVVEAPPGNLAGEIRQTGKFKNATFTISDKHGSAIYEVSRVSRRKEPSRWDKPVFFEVSRRVPFTWGISPLEVFRYDSIVVPIGGIRNEKFR